MNCTEVREYLFAFLDNELAAPLSIELQGHLERCPRCAHDAETERAIRHRLHSAVRHNLHSPVNAGDDRGARSRFRIGWLRWPRPVAGRVAGPVAGLAAALAALVAFALVVRMVTGPGDAEAFFDQLVVESGQFLQRQRPVNITSSDRSVVTDWLRRETKLHLTLPPVEGPWKLVGGRRCTLADRPAAFVLYELGEVPAALVVVSADRLDVDGMQPVHRGDDTQWVGRCQGLNVVVCQRDALLLHAVSTLPAATLDDLVRVHDEDH